MHFISEPNDGLIIWSFGTTVNSEQIPKGTLITVGRALSRLPNFRVVALIDPWLGKELGMPQNVLCAKPIPQATLLGHNSTRLFINHFGGNGVFEAIWSGVPMVGMLCGAGGDNAEISDLVVNHGLGLRIDPIVSEKQAWRAIDTVLTDDR